MQSDSQVMVDTFAVAGRWSKGGKFILSFLKRWM
jgi:hypothetical protein